MKVLHYYLYSLCNDICLYFKYSCHTFYVRKYVCVLMCLLSCKRVCPYVCMRVLIDVFVQNMPKDVCMHVCMNVYMSPYKSNTSLNIERIAHIFTLRLLYLIAQVDGLLICS